MIKYLYEQSGQLQISNFLHLNIPGAHSWVQSHPRVRQQSNADSQKTVRLALGEEYIWRGPNLGWGSADRVLKPLEYIYNLGENTFPLIYSFVQKQTLEYKVTGKK